MMPEMDGIEACEKIREIEALDSTLILFLTARSEEYSELAGFSAGADDYVTKPIKPKLLISRVECVIRRSNQKKNNHLLRLKILQLDKDKHLLLLKGKVVDLARKEFSLLYYLNVNSSEGIYS